MTDPKGWAGARERLADRSQPAAPEPPYDQAAIEAEEPADTEPVEAAAVSQAAAADPAVPPDSASAADSPPPGDAGGDADLDELVEEAEEQVETDLDDLARLAAERDDYRQQLQRLQADFENYRKRIMRQQTEHLERAAEDVVRKLLEVLDNFDLAMAHGESEHLEPVYRSLMGVLEGTGLERLDPVGQPFDPQEHEAVLHEPGDGHPEVIEVMRAGYRWKGRMLRPAMVKVKG